MSSLFCCIPGPTAGVARFVQLHESDVVWDVATERFDPAFNLRMDRQDDFRFMKLQPTCECFLHSRLEVEHGDALVKQKPFLGGAETGGKFVFHDVIDVTAQAESQPPVPEIRQLPHGTKGGDVLIIGDKMNDRPEGPGAKRHCGGAAPDRIERQGDGFPFVEAGDDHAADVAGVENFHQPALA